MWLKEYDNFLYKKEWKELTPYTRRPYRVGTVVEEKDGTFAVYDGAHNYMGYFDKEAKITYNGNPSDYMETFLESAIAFAKENDKI